jgi:hypothetical protein
VFKNVLLKEVICMPKQEKGMGQRQFNIGQLLEDVDFPCDRETLLEQATQNGAGNDVLSIIRRMADQEYDTITEVERAFNQTSQKAA